MNRLQRYLPYTTLACKGTIVARKVIGIHSTVEKRAKRMPDTTVRVLLPWPIRVLPSVLLRAAYRLGPVVITTF